MSEQILLQGKILGIEEFLMCESGEQGTRVAGEELFAGRSQWIALLCEVLPRALLAELALPRILLGSSGGGQFLIILPGDKRVAAEEFLIAASRHLGELSYGRLKLLWSVTENLGDWSVVRKRLNEELQRRRGTPLAGERLDAFKPFTPSAGPGSDSGLADQMALHIRQASSVGWSPDAPGAVLPGAGKYIWKLTPNLSLDSITIPRHIAPGDGQKTAADVRTLARRASGRNLWGILRGDVDSMAVRLRRLQTIEEHVQLSVLYKQFFAGELEILCSLPEFWRKVTILYSGADDFAVYGAWDALILLAREMQRLFYRFTEENLKDFPGPEAKTITMALALAPNVNTPIASVYQEAGRNLELAKSADKDCVYLLGRILEWKQLGDAAELKDSLIKMLQEFRSSRPFLLELGDLYHKEAAVNGGNETQLSRIWRFQRRFRRIVSATRDRDFQKLRAHLINEIVGKNITQVKLRPAGQVALEWARLTTEV